MGSPPSKGSLSIRPERRNGMVRLYLSPLHHENPEIDAPEFERPLFAVIRKLPGEPARIARERDPRG